MFDDGQMLSGSYETCRGWNVVSHPGGESPNARRCLPWEVKEPHPLPGIHQEVAGLIKGYRV